MMSLFRRAVEARLTSEPRYPEARRIPYSGRTAAGVGVTPDSAMQQATAWACRRYLTQTMGQLPARVLRARADGFSERVSAHPVDNVLTWRTNPELAPFQFKETLMGWALTHGNGIAEIERDNRGQVTALWPIHPDRIHIQRDIETDALEYRVNNGSLGFVTLGPMDVFHLRGFGHGPVGLGIIEYAAQSIGWARATELFGASFFGEGMHFGGAVLLPGKGNADSIARMRAEMDEIYKGPTRAGKWFFGDNGATVTKLTATPDEAQFLATLQHQIEEQCRWWGVPPQKVHHLLRMTFNNVEQLSIEVVVDSITPWAIRFEEEANFKLFGQNRQSFFVKLDLKGLLRGDFKSRQEGLQIMRANGIVNANYWAELEEMPKIPTAMGGDKYMVPANMTTLERLGEPPAAPTPPPAADPKPEDVLTTPAAIAGLAIMAGLETELEDA